MQPDPKIRPDYTHGSLTTVTTVRHVAEGEMLRGILGAAPHEVVVPESGYEAAYQLVHGELPQPQHPGSRSRPEPGNLLAVVLIVTGLLAFLIWLSGNV